jgi:LysR family transcriptional regulator, hydrogen peroxide-inducible genes activator
MRLAPHPFSVRQLQYAVAVADTRNFGKAARLCGVSQPSLSAQLGQLEAALGVRLFERDRRRVLPTRAGEELIARARKLLVGSDDLLDAARGLGDPLVGTLRIGVIPTISSYLLPYVVPAIRRAHPRLVLRWIEDKTSVCARGVHDGSLDAALLALEADMGDLRDDFAREVIGRDPFVLAAPRSHPLARSRGPATSEELDGASVLLLDDGHCLREQALAFCTHAGADELGFRATSLPTLAQMVSAGAGITLLPTLAVATEGRRSELAIRPLADERAFRTIGLIWRPTSPVDAGLRTLTATIRDAYQRACGAPTSSTGARRRSTPRPRSGSDPSRRSGRR